jgi:hypothetical protein
MLLNKKGFSLITVIVLSAVALSCISALMYFTQSSSRTTASVGSYKDSLEVAKGASEYLVAGVYNELVGFGHIECGSSRAAVNSYLTPYKDDSAAYDIEVTDFRCIKHNNERNEIYVFKLKVQRKNSGEKAEVEFGYQKIYAVD